MNTDYYISLIHKELSNSTTAAERNELRAWEMASAANKTTAKGIRKAWKLSEMPDENLPFEVNMDHDFAKIEGKITTKKTEIKNAKVMQLQPRRRWLSIAAAVAILVVGMVILQQYFTQNTTDNLAWETISSGTKTKNITLADGTAVTLRAGSKLTYPTAFSDENRPVKLVGEAFFKVAKDKNRPFTVATSETTVTVLGTEFNVRALPTAKKTEVSVQEGKVQLEAIKTSEKVILTANEKGIYQHENKTLKEQVDAGLNDLAWQRKKFVFKDALLIDAIQVVKDYYSVNVELQSGDLVTCRHNGQPKTTANVEDILANIAESYGAKLVKVDAKNFRFIGGKCSDKK